MRSCDSLDHALHPRLQAEELNTSNLDGCTIYDRDHETVGYVSHLHGNGAGAQVIVDVGGFLGIGTKPVAIPLAQLDVRRDDKGVVYAVTAMTRDAVEALSAHHH